MTSRADIRIIRSPGRGDVEVSDDALVLMAACINEALEAVSEWELPIRIGFTIEEVRDLKGKIEAILEQRSGNRS
jgi:hypothetical protein